MSRRRNIFSSFTLWLLVLCLIVAGLEILPVPGIILSFVNATYNLNLILLYLLLGAFVLDCLIGPFPLIALLLPIVGLGAAGVWYKARYDADRATIPAIEAELQGRNTVSPVPFDPATQSMISGIHDLLLTYRIPAIYIRQTPSRPLIVFTIRPFHGCNVWTPKGNPQGTDFTDEVPGAGTICMTRSEVAAPPGIPVEIKTTSATETIEGRRVTVNTHALMVGDTAAAQYITAFTSLLPPWPSPDLGCYLNDSASAWVCVHELGRQRTVLNTTPNGGASNASLIDMLLKLDRRSPDEIAALVAK